MTNNGKVKEADARQAVEQIPWRPKMYRLTTDEFCARDIKRARVMLGGRNPWEVLDDEDDRFTLIIWCLKSRHSPGFTWEDAENTPYGEFLPPAERPPQIEPLSSSGSKPEKSAENTSSVEPLNVEPAPS